MAHLLQTYRLPEQTISDIRRLSSRYGSQSKVIQEAVALLDKLKPKPTQKEQRSIETGRHWTPVGEEP